MKSRECGFPTNQLIDTHLALRGIQGESVSCPFSLCDEKKLTEESLQRAAATPRSFPVKPSDKFLASRFSSVIP